MIAEKLINRLLPTLKPNDTVGQALDWMQEFKVGALALADGDTYVGVFTEDRLGDFDEDETIGSLPPEYTQVFVSVNQHLFEILGLMQSSELSAVAVLTNDKAYEGVIVLEDLLTEFSKSVGTQEKGAVLVLAIQSQDYSMAEISRLIESNNVKILSSYFSSNTEVYNFKDTLTLKLNTRDITAVIATLERFGYEIEAVFANDPVLSPDQDRYDLLMKYLEI
jgi:acetoin utilization protein AcuB